LIKNKVPFWNLVFYLLYRVYLLPLAPILFIEMVVRRDEDVK